MAGMQTDPFFRLNFPISTVGNVVPDVPVPVSALHAEADDNARALRCEREIDQVP
jgi:hypothetical protein